VVADLSANLKENETWDASGRRLAARETTTGGVERTVEIIDLVAVLPEVNCAESLLKSTKKNNEGGLMRLFAWNGRDSSGDSAGTWKKSSLSAYNGNCVEVAGLTNDWIRVRDSKHPRGAVLNFTPAEWDAFVGGVRNGEFDRKSDNH
jgi:hypothetical protein